ARCIEMSAAIKIFSGKTVAVKISFASKRPFSFFITVNHATHQFNSLYGEWIVDQSFRVTGFDLVFEQFHFGNIDQGCIELVKYFHLVGEHMTQEAQSVFQEI